MATSKKEGYGQIRLFVYGTLKKGHGNNVLLQNHGAKLIGRDSITGNFKMVDLGGIPAVVLTDGKEPPQTIYGEVYAISSQCLASVDVLEGHPRWYTRAKHRTNDQKKAVKAWIYTMTTGSGDVIREGMWCPDEVEARHWKKKYVHVS